MRNIAILSLVFVLSIPNYGFCSNVSKKAIKTHRKAISGHHLGIQTASWYAQYGDNTDPWIHTTTANGDKFNENALTAASWKYPLGSIVRVTNIRNGKSVVVKCNDHGPSKRLYAKGRTMDLTKGAFSRIADLNLGVIPIKTELL